MFNIDIQIQIITYVQDGIYIVYSPELDLSGYDKTLSGAHESFKIVLEEFFLYTIGKGTLIADLKKHGWTMTNNKLKPPSKQKIKTKIKNLPKLSNQIEQNYQIQLV